VLAQAHASVGDDLRGREGPDELVRLPKARPDFSTGDRITVIDGPLAGQLGLYEGMRSGERVEVLLMMLGTQRRVEMAKAGIRLV
jgi:transcription antitermination factor NusG